MKYTLRPDQQRALDEARAHVEAGRRSVLIVGPTGFGKSVLIADIARRHVELGGRVLAVVHRIELVQQLAGKLRDAGLQVSEIHPGATAFPASAQVASIQTLLAREVSFEPTLMIWDEAHHVLAETWNKLLPPSGLIVGLTATPMLADGTGLGSVFSSMVVAASRQELRDSGVLVPCEVISPDRALGPRELAQDPVDAYQTHTPGEQAILFAPSVETAIQYACAFRDASVPAAAVWGDMPTKDRERVMAEFRAGSLRVLTSVAILTEGFDHPPTSVCILARGVGHLGLYDQMVGRVLRAAPGKARAVLLDLTGATHHHGPPDEERRYSLDGRGLRRAEDLPDVRFCPVCGSPVAGKECETCGHAGEMRHRPPRVLGLPIQRFARIRQDDDDARARRLGRWIAQARARGWKEGQALHRFKAAYGDFPSRALVARARNLG
jgi:DNA repair protein RadD